MMFEDKKSLSTFLIGVAGGLAFLMVAIAAVSIDINWRAKPTLTIVTLSAALFVGLFLLGGLYIGLPLIKEDEKAKIDIMSTVLFAAFFLIAYVIVNAFV